MSEIHSEVYFNPQQPVALAAKLHECAESILDLATRLRSAIIYRRTDDIWPLLEEEQQQTALLDQYVSLWNDTRQIHDGNKAEPEIDQARRGIREVLERVQSVQRTNFTLAHSFLAAVRRALGTTDAGNTRTATIVYDRRGRLGTKSAPVMVRTLG